MIRSECGKVNYGESMRINSLEDLGELVRETKVIHPSENELQQRVKSVFKRSLDAVKMHERHTLTVGIAFLQNYYRENGMEGMKNMLSKISLLVEQDGFDYLVEIGVIKR